ncbi:hypothetical protein [Pseudomonas syringae group genomosp. 3]|uniref:hypothetical protein n=1 Tax=Pseudomonas syringae group genomosp. 3 TaxID=251701 RepID=UPI000EFD7DB6|nr:hypothetical protein [Pseudomonas syringae group genomosp. 3]
MDSQAPSQDDLELFRRVETDEVGTWRLLHGGKSGAKEDIGQHLQAIDEITIRIAHAASKECYIELISLRLQVMDYWLRLYVENVDQKVTRYREFGRLVEQAKSMGFSLDIVGDLKRFNDVRIGAIHGFMVGKTSYDEIKSAATASQKLLVEVVIFVIHNTGVVLNSRDQLAADVGSYVIHVKDFCAEVTSGFRYG